MARVARRAVADIAGHWNESLHPRDKHGRFVSKNAHVVLPDGSVGTAVGAHEGPGGQASLNVKRADGSVISVSSKDTTVTNAPTTAKGVAAGPLDHGQAKVGDRVHTRNADGTTNYTGTVTRVGQNRQVGRYTDVNAGANEGNIRVLHDRGGRMNTIYPGGSSHHDAPSASTPASDQNAPAAPAAPTAPTMRGAPDPANMPPRNLVADSARAAEVTGILKANSDLATDKQFFDPQTKTWDPARRELQNKIVNDLYERAANVPNDRKSIVAGGLPGAGKTTILTKHAGVDMSQYLVLNPDDVKEELIKRGMAPVPPGLTPLESVMLTHEESSYITNLLAQRAYGDGKNVMWDITMASPGSVQKRIDNLKTNGYSTRGVFVSTTMERSKANAQQRWANGLARYNSGEDPMGGRFIPASVSDAGAPSDPRFRSNNESTFSQMRRNFDDWELWDNSQNQHRLVTTKAQTQIPENEPISPSTIPDPGAGTPETPNAPPAPSAPAGMTSASGRPLAVGHQVVVGNRHGTVVSLHPGRGRNGADFITYHSPQTGRNHTAVPGRVQHLNNDAGTSPTPTPTPPAPTPEAAPSGSVGWDANRSPLHVDDRVTYTAPDGTQRTGTVQGQNMGGIIVRGPTGIDRVLRPSQVTKEAPPAIGTDANGDPVRVGDTVSFRNNVAGQPPRSGVVEGATPNGAIRVQIGRGPAILVPRNEVNAPAAPTPSSGIPPRTSGYTPAVGERITTRNNHSGVVTAVHPQGHVVMYKQDDGSERAARTTDIVPEGSPPPAVTEPPAAPAAPAALPVVGDHVSTSDGRGGIVMRVNSTTGTVEFLQPDGTHRIMRASDLTVGVVPGVTRPAPNAPNVPARGDTITLPGSNGGGTARVNRVIPTSDGDHIIRAVRNTDGSAVITRSSLLNNAQAMSENPHSASGRPINVGDSINANGRSGTITSVRPGTGIAVFRDANGQQRTARFNRITHQPTSPVAPVGPVGHDVRGHPLQRGDVVSISHSDGSGSTMGQILGPHPTRASSSLVQVRDADGSTSLLYPNQLTYFSPGRVRGPATSSTTMPAVGDQIIHNGQRGQVTGISNPAEGYDGYVQYRTPDGNTRVGLPHEVQPAPPGAGPEVVASTAPNDPSAYAPWGARAAQIASNGGPGLTNPGFDLNNPAQQEAFSQALEKMYNGPDGTLGNGYKAEINQVRRVSYAGNGVHLQGTILSPDGMRVGNFTRTVTFSGGKPVEIHNDLMSILPDHQGQGVARDLYRRQENWAIREGIPQITIHANINVGGFAWARQGYDFQNKQQARSVLRQMSNRWGTQPRDGSSIDTATWQSAQSTLRQITERMDSERGYTPTPWELSNIGYTPGAKNWPGKQMLLGTDWLAVKKLTPRGDTRQVAPDVSAIITSGQSTTDLAQQAGMSAEEVVRLMANGGDAAVRRAAAERISSRNFTPPGVTAAAWNESLHPRDRDGTFINKGMFVRLKDGRTGKVTGSSQTSGVTHVHVKTDAGPTVSVPAASVKTSPPPLRGTPMMHTRIIQTTPGPRRKKVRLRQPVAVTAAGGLGAPAEALYGGAPGFKRGKHLGSWDDLVRAHQGKINVGMIGPNEPLTSTDDTPNPRVLEQYRAGQKPPHPRNPAKIFVAHDGTKHVINGHHRLVVNRERGRSTPALILHSSN